MSDDIPSQLNKLLQNEMVVQCLMAVTRLNIAPDLATGVSSAQLAKKYELEESRLARLLRVLVFAGFVAESDSLYSLSKKGQYLLVEQGGSIYPWLKMRDQAWYRRAWQNLANSVQQGKSGFEIGHSQSFFDYLSQDQEANAVFNQAMLASEDSSNAIIEAYDFSSYQSIMDVGGGHGGLLIPILKKHKAVRGGIIDLPHVIATGQKTLEQQGLAHRVDCTSGDFFVSVPSGYDLYLLRYIIHDWDDDSSVKILKACKQAMSEDARLMVIDSIVEIEGNDSSPLFSDLQMMVFVNGQERNMDEFNELFQRAGLQLEKIIPTHLSLSLMILK